MRRCAEAMNATIARSTSFGCCFWNEPSQTDSPSRAPPPERSGDRELVLGADVHTTDRQFATPRIADLNSLVFQVARPGPRMNRRLCRCPSASWD